MASTSAGVAVLNESSHAIRTRAHNLLVQPQDHVDQDTENTSTYVGVMSSRLRGDEAVPLSCAAARLASHKMTMLED